MNQAALKIKDPDDIDLFLQQASEHILSKEKEIKLALSCLLAGGHLLIEDLPGMGKTTFVKCLAKLSGLDFQRIQFTNDLLPSDIIGSSIYSTRDESFHFKPGPLFSQMLMADELNRATPKTQSACLQAMEEHEVSVDGKTHALPAPFFVIATQNPKQSIGTYPLPDSQLDRFMMCLHLGPPSEQAERRLMGHLAEVNALITPIFSAPKLLELQQLIQKIEVHERVLDYIQELMRQLRQQHPEFSPRGLLNMLRAAKAYAHIHHRSFVTPGDVQAVFVACTVHRTGASESQLLAILHKVSVP